MKQKQEERAGVPNADIVSFIRYVEINVYGNQFRLLKAVNMTKTFSLNGQVRRPPYIDTNGTQIIFVGGKVQFSTNFGLTILWDGYTQAYTTLCDSYSNYVCGLCGNANGNLYLNYYLLRNIFLIKFHFH